VLKVTAVSAVVLMLATGAWASIGQMEGFQIGATNYAGLLGSGLVESGNYGTIGQTQEVVNGTGTLYSAQNQGGTLTQEASVQGGDGCYCGTSDNQIWQDANIEGVQGQFAKSGWHGTIGTGTQGLSAGLGTDVLAKNGGVTTGSQSFVGGQAQFTETPAGVGLQTQDVDAAQLVNVETPPHSRADVSSTLNITGTQTQTVTGH